MSESFIVLPVKYGGIFIMIWECFGDEIAGDLFKVKGSHIIQKKIYSIIHYTRGMQFPLVIVLLDRTLFFNKIII